MLISANNTIKDLFIETKSPTRDKIAYGFDREKEKNVLYIVNGLDKSDQELQKYMKKIPAHNNNLYPELVKISLQNLRELYLKADIDAAHAANAASGAGNDNHMQVIKYIKEAVIQNASDIHIVVFKQVTHIKFRVDGDLKSFDESITSEQGFDLCGTIIQSMCDVSGTYFNQTISQDGRMKAEHLESCNLFGARVATRPTDSGIVMIIRLLYDHNDEELSIEELGYLPSQVRSLDVLSSMPVGLYIFSGPTGSGKSTTVATIMKIIIHNSEGRKHVLTVEDPPEYRIPGAVQTALICDKSDDAVVSQEWARSIANAMRLDPDVVLIGEVRDKASASGAIRAAMTGHQVLTTLHANDGMGVLQRLLDIDVNMSLLTDAKIITGLINQSLVKTLCSSCKVPLFGNEHRIKSNIQRERILRFVDIDTAHIKGDGCKNCGGKGFKGRTVVAEVIVTTQPLLDTFRESGKSAALKHWLREGGVTKCQAMLVKINNGNVDPVMAEDSVCLLDSDEKVIGKGQLNSIVSNNTNNEA